MYSVANDKIINISDTNLKLMPNMTYYINNILKYTFPFKNITGKEDIVYETYFRLNNKFIIYIFVMLILMLIYIVKIKNKLELLENKEKVLNYNPIMWIKRLYKEYLKNNQELPKYHQVNENELPKYNPKKAKESPFIGPQTPKKLPKCPVLDEAEKGQNITISFNLPYNRFKIRESEDDTMSLENGCEV